MSLGLAGQEGVDLMAHSGFKLTDLESGLLENSLTVLQSEQKFRDVFFVGRIDTSGANRYYIAFGYCKDILKGRKYFYSLNGYEWLMMPEVKTKLIRVARQAKSFFTGDPANVELVSMVPAFLPDDGECSRATKKIKEEDRLACFVQLMSESAIIPRGALYRQVSRCVTYNPCFRGLSRIDASQLINFQLFRLPVNARNYNVTKREAYNYQTDFFDTIDDLIPANGFTLNVTERDICTIRSLQFPGMYFYHKLYTIYQGFFYFGNGLENKDLLLML